MTSVRLKGLNRVSKRLADGSRVTYWYVWKGGPRLPGEPGSPEFLSAFADAHRARKADDRSTLAGLVSLYKSKPEFTRLAPSTQREWMRWLDRISEHEIGQLPHRLLDDRRVRADILDWRDEYALTPRAADYGMQVLSRVLGFAVQRGVLALNLAAGVPDLYTAERADRIWTGDDLARFLAVASPAVGRALRLACLTGLRRGDLIDLRWREVSDIAVERVTNKSGRAAVIPLLSETRALLREIGRGGPNETVLTSGRRRPWTPGGLTHMVRDAAALAGLSDLRLHDARGTFATRLRLAGFTAEEIAETMGWERTRVERILSRYVERERVVRALAERLNRNGEGA